MRTLFAQLMAVLFVSCGFAFGQTFRVQVIQGNFTWQEAEIDARTRGGRLAVLNTQEKITYVKSYLTPSEPAVYIGLTDELQEGQWKWITGEVLESSNWLPNEGRGGTNENYAVIYPNQNSGWNDIPIGLKRSYLLETFPKVAYFPFDGVAVDASGNGSIAQVNGATPTTDRYGNVNSAFAFDGINDTISASVGVYREVSISLWFTAGTENELWRVPYPTVFRYGGENTGGWPSFALQGNAPNGRSFSVKCDVRSGVQRRINLPKLTPATWYHLAVTSANNTMTVYLDGEAVGTIDGVVPVESGDILLGASQGFVPPSSSHFTGSIDDLRIYDGVLSDIRIAELAGKASESPEAIYIPFGLQPGDEYQLMFVTSTDTAASSSNINDYNSFVQSAADNAGIGSSKGIKWSAVGSTETINARDNATVTGPVYRLDGVKIGEENNIYNSKNPLLASPHITENGEIRNEYTWTGSLGNGTNGNEPLGSPWAPNTDTIWQGYSGDLSYSWLQSARYNRNPLALRPMFALSQVLTVPLLAPDSGKGLRLAKEAGQYGRVQQAVSITRGKQYRAIAEVEGDYSHFNSNKMPELRFPSRDIVFDSFNVTYDGSKTTIETIFTGDVTDDQFLTFSIWTIDEVIFRKIQLIDLETGRDLISNGNFNNGLAFWTTGGGTIDIVDLEGPTTYTLSEGLSTNGSISGFGEFEEGTEVILTAIPDPGFVLDSWTGSASGIQNPLLVTLNQDRTVGASFIQDIRDTDDDGLTNYAELVEFGSDPNDNDTDNDGIADGAEVNAGLNILQPESISEAVAFLTAVRDDVIVQRDRRPTFEQLTDSRLGSVVLVADAETNKVKLRFCIEESDELGQWITREEEAEVEVPLLPGKKFFRFSVKKD